MTVRQKKVKKRFVMTSPFCDELDLWGAGAGCLCRTADWHTMGLNIYGCRQDGKQGAIRAANQRLEPVILVFPAVFTEHGEICGYKSHPMKIFTAVTVQPFA
ncbi:MAG: hypothetical protein ACOCV7_07860 [Desulfonatronovibrionaceae bacterium]